MCRYALMREVADLESGNFRGVCPILNRAKELRTKVPSGILRATTHAAAHPAVPGLTVTPAIRFYNVPQRNARHGVSFARQLIKEANSNGS